MVAGSLDFSLTARVFKISPEGSADPVFQMPAVGLFSPSSVGEALGKAAGLTNATALLLPASMIGLSLFNLCVTRLYFLARHHRFLAISLNDLTFELGLQHGYAYAGYRISEIREFELPDTDADDFLAEAWTDFFLESVNPAVEMIAKGANTDTGMIWNQFGGQLLHMRSYLLSQVPGDDKFIQGFDRHAAILTERLTPDVFDRKRNPFRHRPRYIDNPWQPGGQMVVRSSCCMYDRREGGQKCYNCPGLSEKERERRREEILAAAVK